LPPLQWQPQPPLPLQPDGALALPGLAPADANTDNRLESLGEPQCGHLVPFHLLERTSSSLSRSHFSQ
jgi:hypothetical protein